MEVKGRNNSLLPRLPLPSYKKVIHKLFWIFYSSIPFCSNFHILKTAQSASHTLYTDNNMNAIKLLNKHIQERLLGSGLGGLDKI